MDQKQGRAFYVTSDAKNSANLVMSHKTNMRLAHPIVNNSHQGLN